jgi:hypothetical protein
VRSPRCRSRAGLALHAAGGHTGPFRADVVMLACKAAGSIQCVIPTGGRHA